MARRFHDLGSVYVQGNDCVQDDWWLAKNHKLLVLALKNES